MSQQFGPCSVTVRNSSDPEGFSLVTNPHSWHNYSNMLYIDHPLGVGYSYGAQSQTARSS